VRACVAALRVFAIHPPREIEHQLVEDALEKIAIAPLRHATLDLVDAVGPALLLDHGE